MFDSASTVIDDLTDHRPGAQGVTVHVNERHVRLHHDVVTGLEIKRTAISDGVPIELDFILVEELGHDRTRTIGDADSIRVTNSSRFLANSGDDNS